MSFLLRTRSSPQSGRGTRSRKFCRLASEHPPPPLALGHKLQTDSVKRDLLQRKHRFTHVHRDTAVRSQVRLDDAFLGLDPKLIFGGEAGIAHKAGKAARAIAALLHLGTIGVVDQVFEVNAFAG